MDWAKQIDDPLLREDLEHCFAGDPAERFTGAGQLAENLRNLAERRRRHEERLKLARRAEQRHRVAVISSTATAALLLLAGALGYGFWQAQQARSLAEANAYAADMNLAQQPLLADDPGKARTLAVGRLAGTIELCDPATLSRTATLETNAGDWGVVAFSPAGNLLAASGPHPGLDRQPC